MDIMVKITLGSILAIMAFFILLGLFSKDKNQSDDSWYM